MAVENNYNGPPSLEIYQEFVKSSDVTEVNQNAVIVAQHYNVFKADQADSDDFRDYETGKTIKLSWDDLGTSSELVDKNSVSIVFSEAHVSQWKGEATLKGGNVIKLPIDVDALDENEKYRQIPEPVVVGDKVLVKVGDTAELADIMSIRRSEPTVNVPTTTPGESNAGTGTLSVDGPYSGSSDRVYYITVDSVKESTGSDSVGSDSVGSTSTGSDSVGSTSAGSDSVGSDSAVNEITLKFTTADGTDGGSLKIQEGVPATLGTSGLTIEVTAWGFKKGDTYTVDIPAESLGSRDLLYLNKNIKGDADTAVTVWLGKNKSIIAEHDKYTVSDNGISIGDITQDVMIGNTEKSALVLSGTYFVEYRALCKDFVNRIGYITYDNISEVGYTGLDNPLGAMVSAALKGGRGVYCVGVTADTVEAYRKAFVLLSRSTDTYGIVLGSTNPEVIAEADTFVTQQADPGVANYKIVYYGLDSDNTKTVLSRTSGNKRLMASVKNGKLTLKNSDNATGFMLASVEPGDTVCINYSTDGFGHTRCDKYTVDRVIDDETLELTDKSTNADTTFPLVFEIHRTLEGSELVDELKSRVYCKNHRCYCVFGDGITVDGIEDAPAWLLAALPAGMRAGEYCQRPISNLEYSGCTAENKLSFNSYELKELASRGVWILANNADGSSVYNYHQLSTDMSDKKKQEQSYTTNFDNISRKARSLMSPYYGNSNISDDFIRQLYAHLVALYGSLTTNAPSTEVGPQLISYENLDLRQDEVNRDHVYMEVDYNMPAPFNHVKMYQRLI